MLEVIRVLCEKSPGRRRDHRGPHARDARAQPRGLLRLARRRGQRSADGATLQLTISQEELGKHLGLSRTNVNRQLGQLRLANLIRISGTEISIVDEKGLAEFGVDPSCQRLRRSFGKNSGRDAVGVAPPSLPHRNTPPRRYAGLAYTEARPIGEILRVL